VREWTGCNFCIQQNPQPPGTNMPVGKDIFANAVQ
jgi:hypothetical protein